MNMADDEDALIMIEMDPEDADRCVRTLHNLMESLFGGA